MRSNDSFNLPLEWIKYTAVVVIKVTHQFGRIMQVIAFQAGFACLVAGWICPATARCSLQDFERCQVSTLGVGHHIAPCCTASGSSTQSAPQSC